ncbi:CRISPR-associated protein Cas10/Csm1, subtype III-A/MTUBE [Peptoniphilus harei]|uniref:type III-A CRISPR-associated protein Cas10/Csm1 n=1 Tax=Peptoniphilus harei TaxID=54005 RepID=UPI000F71ED78|nr:type III-A CRISPR-associated protein Cas10/Csm1 [Peptoniphilus harei]QQE47567.1 type III-A CRISPR-associated protein Cas10/Csm1 [Peptoniphilus harei]VEJ33864.1 CRISPR-associated protein Cas10/Csm1, subtype III-A/MTUBE [Peptoniphilus harei]
MGERKIKLTTGVVLGGIEEVLSIAYKDSDKIYNYDFLEENFNIKDKDILDLVIYKNAEDIGNINLNKNSLAYINIGAKNFIRKRNYECKENNYNGELELKSIFNILNENDENGKYQAKYLSHEDGINYPKLGEVKIDLDYYKEIKDKIQEKFKHLKPNKDFISSTFEMLENYLTYIPSSNIKNEDTDISLYDDIKMRTAFANCIYDYFISKEVEDFSLLISEKEKFFEENIFYLYSFDFSGIQNFIYNISSDKALRSLRTRSFYLEILLEDIIDTLLDRLNLFRTNLLYSGGGHCYLILPNTDFIKSTIEEFKEEVNEWLLDLFGNELYLAGGGKACSAKTFNYSNSTEYSKLFREVSNKISKNKLHRYNSNQLKKLNFEGVVDGARECKICRRVDFLKETEDGLICNICDEIEIFSKSILESKIFVVENKLEKKSKYSLPLPFNRVLTSVKDEEEFKKKFKNREDYIRAYRKNNYKEENSSTKIWIGDYCYDNKLNILTENAEGIKRLGVLRADVDNLGQSFVKGFAKKDASLSKSAVFSRNMSLFFKYHINYLLENGEFSITGEIPPIKRKALIVYSGGDDIFVVGAWDDIIEFSIDLVRSLKKFTLNSLTISAGLGIFAEKFPIKSMAEITGDLEDYAKTNKYEVDGEEKTKNSVCLFNKDNIYSWKDFEEKVLGEKLKLLQDYFKEIDDRGKSFLYRLLNLLREVEDDKLNIARLAYLLARLEPQNKDLKERHSEFSKQIYRYAKNEKDRSELITAIYIFVYLERR